MTDLNQVPEARLWVAVIQQAIFDYVSLRNSGRQARELRRLTPGDVSGYQRLLELDEAHRDAERWLFNAENEADFVEVCHCAGLDHEWVRAIARRARVSRAPVYEVVG